MPASPQEPRVEVRTWRRVGRFEVLAHLDSGGMADVFLARGPIPWGLVVVKIVRAEHRGTDEVRAMFRDEARLLAGLDHPRVVRLLDSGEEQGFPWMALEYLEGDHLGVVSRALRRAGRPCPAVLGLLVARQAAEALGYLHALRDPQGRAAGVVHRDVSPQNLFLCADGQLRLLDFGIALHAAREGITRTGLLKGKIAYMPPEQIRGESVDRRADLWALGVCLWELLAGRRLFRHASEFELMTQVCTRPIPDLGVLRPELPEALLRAVSTCLQRDPAKRPRHAEELLAGLPPLGPGELAATAGLTEEILGRRVREKRGVIEALGRQESLSLCLFGDLDLSAEDGADELSADELSPAPRAAMPPLPEIAGPAPGGPVAPAGRNLNLAGAGDAALELAERPPAPPPLAPPPPPEPPPPATPALTPGAAPARPARALVLGLGLLALVGAAAVGAWLWWDRAEVGGGVSAAPPPRVPAARATPEEATPDEAAPDEAAPDETAGLPGPQGLVSTLEPAPAARGRGLLSLECDRAAEVRLRGRGLGTTPLRRVPLPPGRHRLLLVDRQGARRAVEVELVLGRHTRAQVAF